MDETKGDPWEGDLAGARKKLSLLTIVFALIVGTTLLHLIPWLLGLIGVGLPGLLPSWLGGSLAELVLRCVFVSVACALARLVGKTSVSFSAFQVVLGFIIPIFNLFRPFTIMRALARASATDDLPPVRQIVEQQGGYRDAARVVNLVPPPAAPAPAVLAWQLTSALVLPARFIQTTLWAVIIVAGYLLELLVFARLLQRFRARVGHLSALEAQREADGVSSTSILRP
jgi:TRAP-type mannitol/chloroaromatic compound transport system permease small subunit